MHWYGMLEKSEVLLDRQVRDAKGVSYATPFSLEVDAPRKSLRIDLQTYYDMGSPEVITVTIEPGDKLNE